MGDIFIVQRELWAYQYQSREKPRRHRTWQKIMKKDLMGMSENISWATVLVLKKIVIETEHISTILKFSARPTFDFVSL